MAPAVKNPPANAGDTRDAGSTPGSGRFPWRRAWQPTPVFLPGEFHGQRSLEGYSPVGCKELDTNEHACHSSTHLSIRRPQSMKVGAEGSAAVWSWVCSSLLPAICQRSPSRPGRAAIDLPLWDPAVSSSIEDTSPPAPDWRGEWGAWGLVVCSPGFLPNRAFFSLC